MVRISVVLKKNDKFVVKKESFENDLYYGFWEVNNEGISNDKTDLQYISICFQKTYGINISEISYLTTVNNPENRYDFYLAKLGEQEFSHLPSYEIVTEEQLENLNIIYPDAFCRDTLTSSDKSLSDREKDILMAANRLFHISENAARTDTFIALMDNRITVGEFEEYMLNRIEAYKYGMPRFGFSDDSGTSLCIWKES